MENCLACKETLYKSGKIIYNRVKELRCLSFVILIRIKIAAQSKNRMMIKSLSLFLIAIQKLIQILLILKIKTILM